MKKIVLSAALFLTLSGCRKNDVTETPADAPAFSYLKVGNEWVYDFLLDDVLMDSLVQRITSEKDGVFAAYLADAVTYTEEYLFVEGNRLKSYYDGSEKNKANTIAISDAKAGDSWMKYNGTDSSKVEVVEVDREVQTAAGTFVCKVLKETSFKDGTVFHTWASNIHGMIRLETTQNDDKYEWVLRRKNF